MIVCCGQTRKSKFCSDCGKRVMPTLGNLATYLEQQAARAIESSKAWAQKGDGTKPQVKRLQAEADALLAWSKMVAPKTAQSSA